MKNIHLICNAHLDPVWLWEWEEGAAEAISTFRTAADFCEENEGFIFNHNEVILYQWIEEYEPELFKRIQRLVAQGKWHIMGGWYLQPDCNMPSGESFVRQILTGRQYFKEKFGVTPATAINFDPFGHSIGLVQIMKKSGYHSYIFCRPFQNQCPLPADDFIWKGCDGSEIIAHRAFGHYLSLRGEARKKVENWIDGHADYSTGLVLWGIGNHGGGPSRVDLQMLSELKSTTKEYNILHSSPEKYFEELQEKRKEKQLELNRVDKSLNPSMIGCYTSQIRIKQKHRELENSLYMTEKMLCAASAQGYLKYPTESLNEATLDLLTAEFHDILPGSSIQPVEDASLRLLDHGLEIVSKLRARAFFSLAAGQEKAQEGEIPILIYNPHPFKIKGIFECEFQLADQNYEDSFTIPVVYKNGQELPTQNEKELSNLNLDWRKHPVFYAELEPSAMNRFDCKLIKLDKKPEIDLKAEKGKYIIRNQRLEVVINAESGLLDKYSVDNIDYLKENTFLPLVIKDNEDPWGMNVNSFRQVEGCFKLMDSVTGSKYSGIRKSHIESVRVIEDGTVRTVIEAVFSYGASFIVLQYLIPKEGTELQVKARVNWNQKDSMLKLSIPSCLEDSKLKGQIAYGVENLETNGNEVTAQKWTAIVDSKSNKALTCINNSIYGFDFENGELRLSLLRSPVYSGHPINDRPIIPQDRFLPRIDQGERTFSFWLNAGDAKKRLEHIDREAAIHNEAPFALSFFPSGDGLKPKTLISLGNEIIQMAAFKQSADKAGYIIRLFNPTEEDQTTSISLLGETIPEKHKFSKYEIKSYKWSGKNISEVDLMEEPI